MLEEDTLIRFIFVLLLIGFSNFVISGPGREGHQSGQSEAANSKPASECSGADEFEAVRYDDSLMNYILAEMDTDGSGQLYYDFFSYTPENTDYPEDTDYGVGLALLYSVYQSHGNDLDVRDDTSPVGMLSRAFEAAVNESSVVVLSEWVLEAESGYLPYNDIAVMTLELMRDDGADTPEAVESWLCCVVPIGGEAVMKQLVHIHRESWKERLKNY